MSDVYIPFTGREGPFVSVLPSTVHPSPTLSGSGSPEGSCPGVPGQTYEDVDTDDLYLKMRGVQKVGWLKIGTVAGAGGGGGGGGGTSTQILAGDGPADLIIGDPGVSLALYINKLTGTIEQWFNGAWH